MFNVFFYLKKSNLSQVASNLIHQIQHTNGHLPHSEARFLYKAKKSFPPPPTHLNHLNLHIYFRRTFPKSHRIHTELQQEVPTHLVEHRDINIDPKNFQHLAHSFCEWWPVHLLDKIGGEKKKKKKKKAPQSGTNYFPKCTILPFSFFFLFLSLKSIRKCAKPLTILLGKGLGLRDFATPHNGQGHIHYLIM